ncbi:LINE-1 reverse transcriptase-like protein [Smittium mucronatum]|uniref:LINE-1 reverse transcriptase-like protein n=1 Tax=Smittium mucronatum TaxID=133383 RepID=A0A1R0GTN5_9FUNG|nr:LINE-1 reverse transcriptase-like protein [Smittium mucronatum]
MNIWTNHFSELVKEKTGNSRCPSKWEALLANSIDYIFECGLQIHCSEIIQALVDAPNSKAPGSDGISSEAWKLVVEEKNPTSIISKTTLKIINLMYETGDILESMTTSIAVPVPKKGDLKDPDNYRGIFLIPNIVKLLTKIVASKLAKIDNKFNPISKEQTEFRNFEECTAQTTTFYEIFNRRKLKNIKTWIYYIDYSKAYVRVPHMVLIQKLRSIGIGGK